MTSAAKYSGVSVRTIRRILNSGISYDNYTYKFETIMGNPIIVVNRENNTIKEYYSIRAVSRDIAISPSSISKYINTNKLLKDIYLISK
jgi:hypothetical protein